MLRESQKSAQNPGMIASILYIHVHPFVHNQASLADDVENPRFFIFSADWKALEECALCKDYLLWADREAAMSLYCMSCGSKYSWRILISSRSSASVLNTQSLCTFGQTEEFVFTFIRCNEHYQLKKIKQDWQCKNLTKKSTMIIKLDFIKLKMR